MPGLQTTPHRRLFYCDHHAIPLPVGHRFPAQKYALLRAALEAGGIYALQPAPLAEAETIALAHDAEYVRQFLDGTVDAGSCAASGSPGQSSWRGARWLR